MNGERFRFLEHVADAYVEAYGASLEEAFENAALALFEVMTDTARVSQELRDEIVVEGEDSYMLLHDLLTALLVKFETESKLYSRFHVKPIQEVEGRLRLEAEAYGETFNPEKHPSRSEVKGVTHHRMEVKHLKEGYVIRYILDL